MLGPGNYYTLRPMYRPKLFHSAISSLSSIDDQKFNKKNNEKNTLMFRKLCPTENASAQNFGRSEIVGQYDTHLTSMYIICLCMSCTGKG